MGDQPDDELGNGTPLAIADTPCMDSLAKEGKTGLMYTVGKGIAPESDVAVVSLLGYNPLEYDTSRGVMEAVGSGAAFEDGDLALRCNFSTLGSGRKIIDRRVGRDLVLEEAIELSNEINTQVRLESHPASFEFKNTTGHRGYLVIRSERITLSGSITNTDPAYIRIGGMGVVNVGAEMFLQRCNPINETDAARVSAELVNEFVDKSHNVLEQSLVNKRRLAENKLKANLILTRDAGHLSPKFFNISKKYGVKFCCFADMPVEIGIARLAGMQAIKLPPPSEHLIEDLKFRVKKLLNLLNSYDCFYVHIKGPDEPGHDGDYKLKTKMIAIIDKHFFGDLLPSVKLEETILCVSADHATPYKLKAHSDDPVPILISGANIASDGNKHFSEKSCRTGSLGIIEHGFELMPKLMALLRRI